MTGTDTQPLAGLPAGIRVEGVAFAYNSRPVFSNLSFDIPSGEVHALVGRSGIGKTTLLNIVLGLYRPIEGRVFLQDTEVQDAGAIKGVVFREPSLLGWLTVLENILFPNHRKPPAALRARAEGLLAEARLTEAAQQLPRSLSAGMIKRVEVLRALLIDNNYFVGDEPFTALDVHTRASLYHLWQSLREEHPRTGLLCTHDPSEAATLADFVLVMRKDRRGDVNLEGLKVPPRLRSNQRAPEDPFIREIEELMS